MLHPKLIKAFKYSSLYYQFIIVLSILNFFSTVSYEYTGSTSIDIVKILVAILAIIGFINAVKVIKERNVVKKIMALLVNSGLLFLFRYMIVSTRTTTLNFIN